MALTRVTPALFATANAQILTSTTLGGANTALSLTFDESGVISTGANVALQVNTADIADGAITSAKIADGTVVAADVADDSVTVAKLSSSGDTRLYSPAANTLVAYTSTTERMRIDSSGNVGIGTATISRGQLQIASAGNVELHLTGSGQTGSGDGMTITANSGEGNIWFRENGFFRIATNNSERMRIDSSGNVGIGVTPKAWTVFNSNIEYPTGAISSYLTETYTFNNAAFYNGAYRALQTGASGYYRQASGVHSWLTAPSATAGAVVTFTERMRIDSSGNLLVGTTSADIVYTGSTVYTSHIISKSGYDQLTLLSPNVNPTLSWAQPNSSAINYRYASIRGVMTTTTAGSEAGALTFLTSNAGAGTLERMRIAGDGNVLVNTTTTGGGKLVVEATSANQMVLSNKDTGASSQYACYFLRNNSVVGSIQTTNIATSYITSSDYRLKENVSPMSGSIDRLKQLKPSTWSWVQDGSYGEGFLAHEAQEVVPESITGTKDAMRTEEYEVTPAVLDDDGNVVTEAVMGTREVPDYQGIDQSKLVPLLTAALQEAITKIETLETQNTSLITRIEALENA